MRQLSIVQLFSWFPLFLLWVYATTAISQHYFGVPLDFNADKETNIAETNPYRIVYIKNDFGKKYYEYILRFTYENNKLVEILGKFDGSHVSSIDGNKINFSYHGDTVISIHIFRLSILNVHQEVV